MELQQTINPAILIVDDDPISCQILSKMLAKLGYQSDIATSGEDALELLRQCHYNLVIMDYQMPKMDGCITTSLLRDPATKTLNPAVPVIVLTANCMDSMKKSCIGSGMNDLISKPIKYDMLADVTSRWL